MKKFELTAEVKAFFGIKLFRIKALIAFGNVRAGELGGWVKKESNLAQDGNARVYGDARVYGNAWVYDDARVSGNAWVSADADWITLSPIGSENGVLTAFKQKDETVMVHRGCFSGTIEEFESAVNKRHYDNKHGEIYRHVISLLKLRFNLSSCHKEMNI
ncbi:hypothetical protein [Symbiopectobacterium sp. RP]|uniref:hypothetical protein n=1 Tax=Symbiopectobacterium sp. RP TaxID=3248553 RepID=UPI003D2A78F1